MLLLTKPPTAEQLAELKDYVGEGGTVEWTLADT